MFLAAARVTLWLAWVAASAGAAGAHPGTDSRVTAATTAAPIAVPAQFRPFRCVTLRQDTGFGPAVSCTARMRIPGRHSVRLAGMAVMAPADEIATLTSKLDSIEAVLDPGEMEREAADLREQSADPELWTDTDRGQKVTRRLSYLEAELARLAGLRQRLSDTQVLFDLAEEANDEPTKQEAAGDPG